MKKTKEQKSKHKIPKTNNGITLIALVITIIVMLILVAVTISMAVNGGLFDYAGKAVGETENAINAEQQLADGKIQVDGKWYASIDDYIAGKEIKQPYLGLTITTETEEVVYTDKDGNLKELTEEVEDGDIVLYGDYEYRYNSCYESYYDEPDYINDWFVYPEQNGWGVKVKDNTKSKYSELCGTILGKKVTVLGTTFKNCTALTEAPEIPKSVTNMRATFAGCTTLTEVPELPNNITNMKETFSGCTALTNAPEIPNSVTMLDSTFSYCESLTDITIPSNITTLNYTFLNCYNLESVLMTNGIVDIGESSFSRLYKIS